MSVAPTAGQALSDEPIIAVLQLQLQAYDRIEKAANRLPMAFRGKVDPEEILREIRNEMAEVAQRDTEIKPVRDAWMAERQQISAELKKLIDQVAQRLLRVMDVVATAEREALAAKERLQPQISEVAVRHQMRQAYGRSQNAE